MKWLLLLLLGTILTGPVPASGQPVVKDADRLFGVIESLTAQDNGRLWGQSLRGPAMLVDPDTRIAVSNSPAPGFDAHGAYWSGVLPDSIPVANTAFRFGTDYRTMVMWPLPEDDQDLRSLAAHELWHRIQADLGFPMTGPANEHLGSRDGRYLLRLEMRALAAALRNAGENSPINDALAFRARRHQAFPEAAREERELMLHEGLAAYTGAVLAGRSPAEARAHAASELPEAEHAASYVRSFAYALGPAYGLLLDVHRPGWTRTATASDDLADLLPFRPAPSPNIERYDATSLAAAEDSLEAERLRRLEAQMDRYVTGSILVLEFDNMQVSFDPGGVDVLPGHGRIYRSMVLRDSWGTLTVTAGALIRSDWSAVVVPAPDSALVGDGYRLDLAEGWEIVGDRVARTADN